MSSYKILRRLLLSLNHKPTGKTRHFRWGGLLPPPHELQIMKFHDDSGYYLLYLDETGEELTDTYHDSLEKAFSQAEREFQCKEEEWQIVDEDRSYDESAKTS